MNTSDNIVNINLKEYFWSLLEQWKCVIAAGLVFAVLVPVALSLKDSSDRNNELATFKELASMSQEEMLAKLDKDEREAVLSNVYRDQLLKNQSAYNENSIFAGMETDKFTVLHYTFVADGDYAQICPAYASALRDSNTVDILRKNLSDEFKGADEEYIRELILVSGEGAVDLMIVIPEGTNESALASGIEARIEEVHAQIEGALGKHTITYIVSEKQEIAYDEFAADFVNRTHELSLVADKFESTYESMNDTQRNILWMLITPAEEIDAYVSQSPSTDIEFSKGRIAIGFVVGIFLYAFIYLVYIVFSSVVQNPELFVETFKTRNFGKVSSYRYKGLSALVHGKVFYKMHRKGSMGDAAVTSVAESVAATCERNDIHKVGIILAGNMKDYSAQCEKVIKKIKGSRIEVVKLDGELNDDNISKLDGAVICVGSGKTKYGSINEALRICDYNKKNVIGGIYFD